MVKKGTCSSDSNSNEDDADDYDVTDVRGTACTSKHQKTIEEKKIRRITRRTLTAAQVNSSDLETD